MTYKVVCNTVIPEPIPSKSRLGSADGARVGFLQRTISIIGAYSDLGRDTLYVAVLRQLSSCLTDGGACAFLIMSAFQSAFALKYPRDPFHHARTAETFQRPSKLRYSPTLTTIEIRVLLPTVCPLKLSCARTLTPVFPQGEPQKQKLLNPLLPSSLHRFWLRRGR